MTDFDDRFADRARDVFDGYDEPVDEAAWRRMRAALGHAPPPAADRAPITGSPSRRLRGLVALATLLVVGGTGLWVLQNDAVPDADRTADTEQTAAQSPAPSALPGPADASAPTDEQPAASNELATLSPAAQSPTARPAAPLAARQLAPTPRRSPAAPSEAPSAPAPTTRDERAAPPLTADDRDAEGGAASPEWTDAPADELAEATPRAREAALDVAVAGQALVPSEEPEREIMVLGDRPVRSTDRMGTTVSADEVSTDAVAADRLAERRSNVNLVLATNAAFSDGQLAEGAGVTGGLAREWRLGRGLAISTGAQAAYTRFALDTESGNADPVSLADLEADPDRSLDVTTRSTLQTLALEVPVDLSLNVLRAGGGRVRAGAGLTTALYLAQRFDDEGQRIAIDQGFQGEGSVPSVTSRAFQTSASEEPLSRVDLVRQLNLSLGVAFDRGRTPFAVEAYSRLPLGGLTSRDLPLTSVGVRLRVGL